MNVGNQKHSHWAQIAVGALVAFAMLSVLIQRHADREDFARAKQQIESLPSSAPSLWGPSYIEAPNVEVAVNGVTFSLPRNQLLSATSEGHTGFMLVAHWPDMGGVSEETAAAFASPGTGSVILIWVDSSLHSAQQALDTYLELKRRDNVGPTQERAPNLGLREFRAIGLRDGYEDNIGRQDYFVPWQASEVPVHIFCTSISAMPTNGRGRQTCSEMTIFEGIRIEIKYDRALLSEWRDVHARTIDLLRSFKSTTPSPD